MSSRRHRPSKWPFPTPFRDSRGGRITIPVSRPSFHAVVLAVGFVTAAHAVLAASGLNHHAAASGMAYSMCVVGAGGMGALLTRHANGDRVSRGCCGTLGVGGLFLGGALTPQGPPETAPLVAVGVIVVLSVASEIGFRLWTRRANRRPPAGPPVLPPSPAGPF